MAKMDAYLLEPPRRQSRWERQAFSFPVDLPCTPTDSGYGSQLSSPEQRLLPLQSRVNIPRTFYLDGNDSHDPWDSSPDSSDDEFELSFKASSPKRKCLEKPATLPRPSCRSRTTLPAAFFSDCGPKPSRRGSSSGHGRTKGGSLRLPDRFVPQRSQASDMAEIFRISKLPHELTASERVLRHDADTTDAFYSKRRPIALMASDYRHQSRSESGVGRGARFFGTVGTVLGPLPNTNQGTTERQLSVGTVWAVGGVAPGGTAVNNGRGTLVRSGTNARLFTTSFSAAKSRPEEELEKHEGRLALALDIDRVQRVLGFDKIPTPQNTRLTRHLGKYLKQLKTYWNGTEWIKQGPAPKPLKSLEARALPIAPFKVLDAPNLRDDFYCSTLAYSPTCHTLAVGLGGLLYGWSDPGGVKLLNSGPNDGSWLTALSFSSAQGCKCILAFGWSNNTLALMSLYDSLLPRFEVTQPSSVAALSWRPTCTIRPSRNPYNPGLPVKTEDLLVGDEMGHVYYYSVEWPDAWEVNRNNWPGEMTLLARISVHSQQICGISWSPNGVSFATGGNDNLCCLFEAAEVLGIEGNRHKRPHQRERYSDPSFSSTVYAASELTSSTEDGTEIRTTRTSPDMVKNLKPGSEKHKWEHGAAVKAIAFCPWREGLVATGGGSNDKCIHFFHTTSGAALATISVSAQVTSLIWSTTRREIAATFGYAQPEHPYRIAVFSWPDCRQVAAIPWEGEHRALYAIPYPGGPNDARADSFRVVNGEQRRNRTAQEGCIVVAASDESVKFHEVWSADKKAVLGGVGMLGGSDILEGLEGIDKEGDIIR